MELAINRFMFHFLEGVTVKSNKLKLILLIAPIMIVALVAWLGLPKGVSQADAALAEYKVEKLTCGSCVSNIQTALKEIPGVGAVEAP